MNQGTGEIELRDAAAADALALAELTIMAGHGLHEIFYGGLFPGRTTAEVIAERRILNPANFAALHRWRVAADATGRPLGALNSFDHAVFDQSPPDPLLTAERLSAAASIADLEARAAGTWYVNIVAVYPASRSGGLGARLMDEAERLARASGFRRVTLATFESDARLVGFYRRLGYDIVDTRPIDPHPLLEYRGNWALMARDLAP